MINKQEINLTRNQQTEIKLVFGGRYSKKILEHFEEMGVVNSKGEAYSDSYLRQVFCNIKKDKTLTLNMLNALVLEKENQKVLSAQFKKDKEIILQKKAVAVTTA